MSGYDSAMASGATGSDPIAAAQMRGHSSDAAMPAAPTTPSKRSAAAGGSSPKFLKRAARRELVGQIGSTPTVSHEQLAAEVHRYSKQAELDAVFFENTTGTLDVDHIGHVNRRGPSCECCKD